MVYAKSIRANMKEAIFVEYKMIHPEVLPGIDLHPQPGTPSDAKHLRTGDASDSMTSSKFEIPTLIPNFTTSFNIRVSQRVASSKI
jgi:hypothetical protein